MHKILNIPFLNDLEFLNTFITYLTFLIYSQKLEVLYFSCKCDI